MIFVMKTVLKMKYYSEADIRKFFKSSDSLAFFIGYDPIHVRRCRDCEYFGRDHPTINTDGDFGYCKYHTDFMVLDDEPINWYFTDINGFCNEDDIEGEDR